MRWHPLFALLILSLLLFAACDEVKLVDDERRPVLPPRNVTDGRPEIPRSNPPQDTPDDYVEPVPPQRNQTPIFIPNGTPGTELDVRLGDAIGKDHKIVTQREFRLLRHAPVRVDANELVGYEETIRFDFGSNSTGKVIFGKDDEEIGTFLRFEKGKPVLEYRLQLKQGTFEHYSGRDIQVLGHTYVIAEATNTTLSLYGRSVASNLFFANDSDIEVNSSAQGNTLARVTPTYFSFIVYAKGKDDGGVTLSPGEGLRKSMGNLVFGTDLMDIRYKGAPQLEGATIDLTQDDEGYRLRTTTAVGPIDLPLASFSGGKLVLGDGESGLRITQCGYCVAPGDYFLITTADGRTHLLRYSSLSINPDMITIREGDTKHSFEFKGNPGKNATTDIIIDGKRFPVKIGAKDNRTGKYNLSIEQGFRDKRVDLVLANGALLRIGTPNASVLPLQVIVPAAKSADHKEQVLRMNITYVGGWHVNVANVTFVDDEKTDDAFGVTPYGMLVHLKREDARQPLNVGDDATIIVPVEPLYGIVTLED